ncbi:hypothetical protein GQ457_11G005480 [Hibiscus cannabinus]
MHREMALHVVSDATYYSIFRQNCRPLCYNDEHYIPTHVLRGIELEPEHWSRVGAHPRKFESPEINEELLNRLRYGSECIYNGNTTSMCFLFASKFSPGTLKPLLDFEN